MPIDTHTGQVSKCRIKAEASRTFLQGRSGHFRTLSMMSTHNCSREDCPTTNVNGPKITCVKCKKPQFLQCHAQKHSSGLIRIPLPTGASIYVEMQNMQFGCASCHPPGRYSGTNHRSIHSSGKNNAKNEISNCNEWANT